MAIALATTTVTITGKRPQSSIDPDAAGYDVVPPEEAPEVLATGVRACITLPQGTRRTQDADAVEAYAFKCDPVEADVSRFDTITDEQTGTVYNVAVVQRSLPQAFGLDHITGRVYLTKGLSTEGGGTLVTA